MRPLNRRFTSPSKLPNGASTAHRKIKAIHMKKLIIPGFLMLFAMGLVQQKANAGSFSFGISIGGDHRYRAPAPVIVAAPQVIYAPPVVVAEPRVVVAEPSWAPGYAVVR